ncbi:MAG: adenylyl-sulfate kinase [Elusimicrobia bacterium]|nr:adenylyl-sulfate kinase [Elusimicrobiota bacterium]
MRSIFTIWLTGLPASGKTTLALALKEALESRGRRVVLFDGDEIRRTVSKDLGFSREDRAEQAKRVGELCLQAMREEKIAVVALVSPYRADREAVRCLASPSPLTGEGQGGGGRFVEVFVRCPIEVCASRDVKGLYPKAKRGEIPRFTGVSDPYEEPESPEIIVDTARNDAGVCAQEILGELDRLDAGSPSFEPDARRDSQSPGHRAG